MKEPIHHQMISEMHVHIFKRLDFIRAHCTLLNNKQKTS